MFYLKAELGGSIFLQLLCNNLWVDSHTLKIIGYYYPWVLLLWALLFMLYRE